MPAVDPRSPTKPPSPPRTRRRLSADVRRQALIDAAFEEFIAKGYAGARLTDIARNADAASGLVAFHFGGKAKLFEAVVQSRLAPTMFDPLEALFDTPGISARALMTALLETIYTHLVGDRQARELLRLIIAEGPKFPEMGKSYYEQVMVKGLATIQRIVAIGVARGEFRADAIALQAQVVHGAAAGALLLMMIFEATHPPDLDQWRNSHLDLVLRALAA